ncbi:MAG TPA: hypothetical protein VHB49_14110 [Bradyrhizobium sp.]|nr:hypothetical protein [Bradyrhizobium sp.]
MNWRLRIACPGYGKPFAEILRIEPLLCAQYFQDALVPDPRRLDIEIAMPFLVDGLHAIAGHGPLPADPKDVAVQRHFSKTLFLRKFWTAGTAKDSAAQRYRNNERRRNPIFAEQTASFRFAMASLVSLGLILAGKLVSRPVYFRVSE